MVCPIPQSPPTRDALQMFLRSLTIVETAAKWSASIACFNPKPVTKSLKEYSPVTPVVQQILGSCSPASISTMRVPPKPVIIATIPCGSCLTSPMMQASRP